MFEQPEPEFELVKLSDDARKALAKRVHGWLDSAELTKSTRLEARWKRNQEFYRDCPQNAVTNTVAGMPAMHFPLVSPRIDALGDAILDTVFKQSPVFMPEMSGESEDVDLAKAIVDYFVSSMRLEDICRCAFPIAAYTNAAILRVIWDDERSSTHVEWIDPVDFAMFDPSIHDMHTAAMVGHSYTRSAAEVRQAQARGEFYDGVNLKVDSSGSVRARTASESRIDDPPATSTPADGAIKFWELVAFLDLSDIEGEDLIDLSEKPGKGKFQRYLVTYAPDTQEICAVTLFGLSNPNYAAIRLLAPQYGNWWTENSACNKLQALQELYNHINSLLVGGSYMAAFPPISRVAALGPNKSQKYGPGQIIDVAAGEANVLATRFDPGALIMMVSQIERNADAVVGVNQASIGVQFKDKRTLGENQMVQQGTNVRTGGYIQVFTSGLEQIIALVAEILAEKEQEWGPVHGHAIPGYRMGEGARVLRQARCWTAQGRTPDQNPDLVSQKMQMLYALASQAAPDMNAVAQGIGQALQELGLDPQMAQQVIQHGLSQSKPLLDVKEILRSIVNLTNAPNRDRIMAEDEPVEELNEGYAETAGGLQAPPDMAGIAGLLGGAMQGGPVGAAMHGPMPEPGGY